MGPLGQALGTAMMDLAILHPVLKENICILGGSKLLEYMNLLEPGAKGLHPNVAKTTNRRISVIKDKECKNRPIAIFDYWSQTVLIPLHKSLFRILKSINTDLTFNQDGVSQILQSPFPSYHSLDLTAATDRFPVSLQRSVLQLFLGKEKADAWKYIMTLPLQTPTGETISYEVGQPMGAYSSWAMFTLCHHIVVQYSAHQAGKPT